MQSANIGLAIIGSGRIGTHRARLAATHPAVRFLALTDVDESQARDLGATVGADLVTTDAEEAIGHPDVTAVIVSSSEHAHTAPVLAALEAGKPVLVEKPIALTVADADRMIATARDTGTTLRVGYSQRYKREHFLARQQIDEGRLGQLASILGRVYNTRASGLAILERSPTATPVIDVLTYLVDLSCWFLGDSRPIEVVARGAGNSFRAHGHRDVDDVTWCMIRFDGGAVVTLGVSYALPSRFPTQGQSIRLELLGDEGVLLLDEDGMTNLLYTDRGYQHAYVPDHEQPMAFLGTRSPGDWALGRMFGPLAEETRAWLDHLATGAPEHLATPEDARQTLAITLAIEEAADTGQTVSLASGAPTPA